MNTSLIIAASFLIVGVLAVIKNKISGTEHDFLWFCDFAPFLLAIAFFFQDSQLNKAIINVGLLTQLVTLALLLYGFARGMDIIGTKEALARGKTYVAIELLIHLPVIVALVLTYNVAPKVISLIYSFILIVFMFLFTLMFTSPKRNINLLYNLGIPNGKRSGWVKLPFHTVLWIIYTFIVAAITFLIQQFIYVHIGT